ncbi:glycosyltransferase family 2 protein [Sphingobacterium spiritivorum]|uniref:glycosyltransferase family 2 protein n=1 Tax=Sphingobacterium spiritivorum TaxID=258 RepID=UPI003DA663D4
MDISIIIVNYNTASITLNCLRTIYEFTKDVSFEIILVDNASTDDSVIRIKKDFPEVLVLESEENMGFGNANNLAAQRALGNFLFFLNSDTLLIENSLKKLLDFFLANEDSLNLGVLGCILVDEFLKTNGFGSFFPHPKSLIHEKVSHIPFLRSLVPATVFPTYSLNDISFKVDYVIGADMFIRREVFEYFKGFDKDYFMYYEESDLQLRMQRAGYSNHIYTGTKIIHLEDGSGKSQHRYSNRKRTILHESRITYVKKNFVDEYPAYKRFDQFMLFMTFFNIKYSFRENWLYIKSIIKKY